MSRRCRERSCVWCWAVIVPALLPALMGERVLTAEERTLSGEATATLRRYCLDCHADELAEARINLDRMTAKVDLGGGFRDWEKVIRVLRGGKMPPPEALQPNQAERESAAAAIERALDAHIAQHAGDPGAVVLRRLTSAEYGYTIHDLTGLDLKLEGSFVSDAAGGEGFTNVGGAQFLQDSTLERYLEAAQAVAEHAVIGAGPLAFFEHPGLSGRELSAITRIKEIYRQHGFRTAAGEGAEPFGLDLYPRALLVAWRFRHRAALKRGDATLSALANEEGVSERLCQHVWAVLNEPATSFPLTAIVAQWQALPPPSNGEPTETEIRAECDRLAGILRDWQGVLAASAGDEEEAAVLTAGEVQVRSQHELVADIDWEDEATAAEIELSVATASKDSAAGALVIWRNPRMRFVRADRSRGEFQPLGLLLGPQTHRRLQLGRHPAGLALGNDDFVLAGDTKVPVRLVIPKGTIAARLYVDVELDTEHGADRIVRCRIADGAVASETAAEVGDTSTLLGNPASEGASEWKRGVAEFARLLPEVSHREPTPSDRDPIPAPFDNAYNMPERNHFHYAIKYHRDDRFLVEHVLDDATRVRLDRAWADLLTSFDYHDAYARFVAQKYGVDLAGKSVAELTEDAIERMPEEPRRFIRRLHEEQSAMRQALAAAEPGHIEDALAFAQRAWRRPLSTNERERLRGFYTALRAESDLDHAKAVRALVARILVAPAFLYRAEPAAEPTAIAALNDWELASRLSYFLWSSLPDDELLRAASAGELGEADQLAKQARRMARDAKARRFAAEFFGQWLGFYRFPDYRGIDTGRFPEFNEPLKIAMYDEAVTFFEHVVREDRPVEEVLFADYSFLNAPLARHYGIDADDLPADRLVRVSDVVEQHRGGLLGLAAVLTPTSAPLRTSAVKRGDWVLRRLLGTAVPPPPADAGSIPADEVLADGLTVRQRLEAHRADSACSNCHARIDPLGFALEHYDPIGRWRERYQDGQAIDASGTLSDGTRIDGLAGLRDYLRREQGQFERTLCVKLLGYALGRSELASDRPLIDQMLADLEGDGRFSELVVRIVTSKPFRYRRP